MGVMSVISSSGDNMLKWDTEKLAEGDPEVSMIVQEAERIFKEETERGARAFKVQRGTAAERIDKFDKTAEHIIIVPNLIGG